MAANDVVARYILKFDDLASKGLIGVAGKARMAAVGLAGVAAAAGAAAVAAGGFVLNAAQKYSEFVDGLDEASAKMGVNINYLKDLRSAMGKMGVEQAQVDAGLTKFAVTMGKLKIGGKALANVPPALQNQLRGARDATEANRIALGYLSTVTDATERAAIAATLYGKSAGPAFAGAVSDIDALNKAFARSRQLTGVITPDAVKMASDYQDRLADMQTGMMALQMTVGAAAIPALSGLIDRFNGFMIANKDVISSGLTKFFDKFAAAVEKIDWQAVGDGFIGLMEALPTIIPLLAKIAEWLPEIVAAWLALNAIQFSRGLIGGLMEIPAVASRAGMAMNTIKAVGGSIGPALMRGISFLGPWGLAIGAAGGAAFALYQNWDTVGPMIQGAVGKIGDYLMAFADTDWFAKGQEFGSMITNWFNSIEWGKIGAWFMNFYAKIGAQLSKIDFVKLGGDIGAKLAAWFASVDWSAVGSVLFAGFMLSGRIMLAAVKFIGGLAWSLLTSALGAAWNYIKSVGQAAWDGIKQAGANAINFLIDKINALILKWNGIAPAFAQIPTIERVGASNANAAEGAAGRGGQTKFAMTGEATVNLKLPDGRSAGTATVPFAPASNKPRRPAFGMG